MRKQFTAIIATLLIVLFAGAAQAALVTETFSGTITYAADDNVFGVSTDDIFSWATTYDISYLASDGYLVIGDSDDMALSVTVGSRTFVETEDDFYGSGDFGAPLLEFDADNNIIAISFTVVDNDNGYQFVTDTLDGTFAIYLLDDEGTCTTTEIVTGAFSFDAAPVPVPAAAWLLGSGLLGVLGLRRRKA
ncbi:PEP-CTERM sorting domain-containing protein [uncultured Desulfosarcina sp.]|uniref:PEP-CTERM sorting domain-containing protein n=1 Tax=uncultured Desulfosarcina sp. TaxID=218289 RepID=UPI0029C92D2F|nr:PEP-CTERM sorting domain-containing protein [uncultured Desulfosarcina sp.]